MTIPSEAAMEAALRAAEEKERARPTRTKRGRAPREPKEPKVKTVKAPKAPKEPKEPKEKPRRKTAVEKRLDRQINRQIDLGIKATIDAGLKQFNKNPERVMGPLRTTFKFLAAAGIVGATAAAVVKLWKTATASADARIEKIAQAMLAATKAKIPPSQWTPAVATALLSQYRAWAAQEDQRLRQMTYTK